MLKICVISHSADLGGSERSLLYLLQTLNKKSSIKLLVILPKEGLLSKELQLLNINYLVHDYDWWVIKRDQKRKTSWNDFGYHLENAALLTKKVIKFKPDLILTNTSVVCVGALVAYMLKIPHVWHIRELGERDHGFIFKFGFKNTAEFINQFSSVVIYNSKATKSEFSKYIPNNKSAVVYNSIRISPKQLNKQISIRFKHDNYFKILIAGTISYKKGQTEGIKAISLLLKDKINIETLIVGKCTNENLLKKINLITSKYFDNFQVKDFVKNPYPLFKQCDMVLVCSKNEAFGRTILEGMFLQKLVIATNSGGAPEIIINGENGYLYSSGNVKELSKKIKLLINNPKLSRRLAKNGFVTSKTKFTNRNYSIKLLNILKSKLNRPIPSKKFLKKISYFPSNSL